MTPPAPTLDDSIAHPEADGGSIFTPYRRTQFVVAMATVTSFLMYWWSGEWMRIPEARGFNASLLQQPYWPLVILATYLIFACTTALGTMIAGRFWFFGGLFAGTTGLAALSTRGGPMHYVLFDAASHGSSQGMFVWLVIEQCLLFLPIGLAWLFFWSRYPTPKLDPDSPQPSQTSSTPLAIAAQIAFIAALVILLAPTDAKKQVLIGLFIASLAGTSLAEYIVPDAKAPGWYWVGPFAVGAIGYVMAFVNASPWTIGSPNGMFAALARPLPLDYASAGIAGALLGFWISAERAPVAFSFNRKSPPA